MLTAKLLGFARGDKNRREVWSRGTDTLTMCAPVRLGC